MSVGTAYRCHNVDRHARPYALFDFFSLHTLAYYLFAPTVIVFYLVSLLLSVYEFLLTPNIPILFPLATHITSALFKFISYFIKDT